MAVHNCIAYVFRVLDLTLPTPEDNLAVDESLLAELDLGATSETLRFWESSIPCVIVGLSGKVEREVDVPTCAASGIPILRRASGGGAVVLAAGCLNYSLVLSLEHRPELRDVPGSYGPLLGTIARGLELDGIEVCGQDLARGGQKFAGSSQKRARSAVLHHGTVLCGMDLSLIERALREPSRMPAWRAGRAHMEFVCNLPLTVDQARSRIARAWSLGA